MGGCGWRDEMITAEPCVLQEKIDAERREQENGDRIEGFHRSGLLIYCCRREK